MKNKYELIIYLGLFIFLALLDLGFNLIGLVPGLGDFAESISELILEGLQLLLFSFILVRANK